MSELNINMQDIRNQLIDYKKVCEEQIAAKEDAKILWEEIEKLLGSIILREYNIQGMESIIVVVRSPAGTFKQDNRKYSRDLLIAIYKDSLMAQKSTNLSIEDFESSEVQYTTYNGKNFETESFYILSKRLEGEDGYEDVLEKMQNLVPESHNILLAFQINLT